VQASAARIRPLAALRDWLLPRAEAAVVTSSNCRTGDCVTDNLQPVAPVNSASLKNLGMDKIASWLMGIVSSLAVLFAIWGGIQYMSAGGDLDRQLRAKHTLIYSLVGVVTTVLAYAIVMQVLRLTYSAQ